MNRLVLIGNGFDLAHGLPTRYEDFINWYWDQRVEGFRDTHSSVSRDILCEFKIEESHTWNGFFYDIISPIQKLNGKDIIDSIIHNKYSVKMKSSFSPFFSIIIKSIETKGWVDIENEYYNQLKKCTIEGSLNQHALKGLNSQLSYITDLLVKYLESISKKEPNKIEAISDIFYSAIRIVNVSIEGQHLVDEYLKDWVKEVEHLLEKDKRPALLKKNNLFTTYEDIKRDALIKKLIQASENEPNYLQVIRFIREYFEKEGKAFYYPELFMLPETVLILNFNYTNTADSYERPGLGYTIYIHGELEYRDSIIFGYGDELDEKYQQLQALNENECLKNIKSIKYLESGNYRSVLNFLEAAPFQVLIMGHSCGNSDRTLLNTIFEHKNCISIKPYYYKNEKDGTDNYLDIVQNISRNFTNMKLMRDRVVNKTFCEPLPQVKR